MKIIYSFDVFDTCLTRPFLRPTDLFYILFSTFPAEQQQELVRLRIKAENVARQKETRKEDITLQQIYDQLDLSYYQINKNNLQQQEIALEIQSVKAISSVKKFIQQRREEGHKIIFISDMYFPQEHIEKMLKDNNLSQANETLYLSNQIGLTKTTGNLFKYVLQTENIQPHQLHHTGDNLHSDIAIAQQLGIKTTHFKAIQPTRYEKQTFTQSLAPLPIRSQIAGISRATRLSSNEPSHLTDLTANVIAPLLTSYTAWVLQHAQQNGIKRLYFVSRDGQILLKIAQQLAIHLPSPECRYLYGSRQAWFLPSITQINRQNLDWLIREGQSNTPYDILQKLQIHSQDIASHLHSFNFLPRDIHQPLQSHQIEAFWQVITTPEISQIILQKAQTNRRLALAYFQQEGLFLDDDWAIVDLGWMLRCQKALSKILNRPMQGYYFGVRQDAYPSSETGTYYSYLLQDSLPYNHQTESIFKNVHLLDQIFTVADHPLTVGYQEQDQKIIPIFKEKHLNQTQVELIEKLHQTIIDYAQNIEKTNILKHHHNEFKYWAISHVVTCFTHPQSDEVKAIADFQTSNDQNDSNQRPVARPITLNDLIYFARRATHLSSRRDYHKGFDWLEGAITLSNPLIKLAYLLFQKLQQWKEDNKPLWLYKIWLKIRIYLKK